MSALVVATATIPQPTPESISDPQEWEIDPDAVLDRLFAMPPWPPRGWESRYCPSELSTESAAAWLKETIRTTEILDGRRGEPDWQEYSSGTALRDAHRLAVRLGLECPAPLPEVRESHLSEAAKLRQLLAAVQASLGAGQPVSVSTAEGSPKLTDEGVTEGTLGLRLNQNGHTVSKGQQMADLSRHLYHWEVFRILFAAGNEYCDRERLEGAWPDQKAGENCVYVAISDLRRSLSPLGITIENKRHLGWRLAELTTKPRS